MSSQGLESIEQSVQTTHRWINELNERLDWGDKARSYRLLRTVLQALRDWLPVNEAVDLAAQLPELVRGAYYEHWRPAKCPVQNRSREDFLARVDHAFKTDPIAFTPEVVTEVFGLLSDKVSAGEIEDVRNALPADVRALWPKPARAA
ncbi:MAG: DUF2267 domain-containing protein [Pseudorhodoplanes sp.]|nr:hypothetical protein [Pseudorhodoplanes sp.]MBW7948064.1 DUF2267 domain-containing protein [Pseudorhodoplanes sp.]MCL4711765.1 DUF2267 domain-containing protein [Pseudorhodoplanes sp.]GIK81012.1 MAG: hypothetical protein BroJett024_21170 [Alphaproteobacteria bacterium]